MKTVIATPRPPHTAIVAEAARRAASRHPIDPSAAGKGYCTWLLVDELARMVFEARGWSVRDVPRRSDVRRA